MVTFSSAAAGTVVRSGAKKRGDACGVVIGKSLEVKEEVDVTGIALAESVRLEDNDDDVKGATGDAVVVVVVCGGAADLASWLPWRCAAAWYLRHSSQMVALLLRAASVAKGVWSSVERALVKR